MGNIYRVCPRLWFTDCVSLSFGKEKDRQGIRWGKDLLLMTPILWYNCIFWRKTHQIFRDFLHRVSFLFFFFTFTFHSLYFLTQIGLVRLENYTGVSWGKKKKPQLYPYIRVQHIFWSCCAFLQSLFVCFFFFSKNSWTVLY